MTFEGKDTGNGEDPPPVESVKLEDVQQAATSASTTFAKEELGLDLTLANFEEKIETVAPEVEPTPAPTDAPTASPTESECTGSDNMIALNFSPKFKGKQAKEKQTVSKDPG